MASGTSSSKARILCIVGARPNFIKIAPIMRVMNMPEYSLEPSLLHTGQHYDAAMKHSFFEQLHIPEPDIDLGVGSASHAVQTAEIMKRLEPVLKLTLLFDGFASGRPPACAERLNRCVPAHPTIPAAPAVPSVPRNARRFIAFVNIV